MAARALVAIIALSSLVASFFDLALLTWMAELVPPGIRGRFLGTRNRISGLAGQVTALAAAAVIQGMFGETARSPFVFAVLFAVAGSLGLAALPVLARVPPPRRTRSRIEMLPLRNMLVAPLRDRNVRIFMLFAVLWHAAIGISSPFLLVFMLEELGLSLLSVTALVSLNLFVAAGTMGYWGRLGDHFGAKTVLRAGTYLIMLPTVVWLIVAPGRTWPIVIFQFVAGLGWGAYNSNVNNLMLKLAPAGRGPSYVASLGAVTGMAEAIGPLAGGVILAAARGWTGSTLLPYYIVVVIAFVLRAVATFVPGHVHEPGGVAVGRMVRTVGRFHAMNVEEAFSPLFTHIYTHVARVADFIAREPAIARHEGRV